MTNKTIQLTVRIKLSTLLHVLGYSFLIILLIWFYYHPHKVHAYGIVDSSAKAGLIRRTDTPTKTTESLPLTPPSQGGLSVSLDLINKIQEAQKPKEQPVIVGPEIQGPQPTTDYTPPPVTYANTYDWGNCTWAVANWVNVPDDLGNANQWAYNASSEGFTVSPIPKVGSVAQTSAGDLGHVAYVEDINGSQVLIKEANVQGLGVVDERWVDSGQFSYIYFSG